ncbi:unnamed protein product [Fraxinus pennsylvanica]|uniref:RIN4 pathogenic type III effector avirulence factor Avr cleavage site domain-containing protein n=1 Tax=Fraxinus pennsylvanica TaxID=56036 RepID=A0AAD1ZJR3_9LAMI|nr:unnamed protein product [Fraxinus pennsylvanica]
MSMGLQCPSRPTALQDRNRDSDEGDVHNRDYDVAALAADNLGQAFRYTIYENDDAEDTYFEVNCGFQKWSRKCRLHVMIVLKGSIPLAFGGTEQPATYRELASIGGLNPDINKKLSAAIANILETKLSVPKSRYKSAAVPKFGIWNDDDPQSVVKILLNFSMMLGREGMWGLETL